MARDRCPGGLRRRRGRGLSRRRRRVNRYGQGPGRGGLQRCLQVGAAAEESQVARRASGGGGEERNGGAGGVEGRQTLEEQRILEGSDHVQNFSSVGFQAKLRRSVTGGSLLHVSGVCWSDRWTARRGAPPCDLGSYGKYCNFAGSRRNGGWIGAMQGEG